MKKVIYSAIAACLISTASFAQDNNVSNEGPLVNGKRKIEKGPKYKNEYSPAKAESFSMVNQAEARPSKGPKYKNERTYRPVEGTSVNVVRYNVKGPKFKNERFK